MSIEVRPTPDGPVVIYTTEHSISSWKADVLDANCFWVAYGDGIWGPINKIYVPAEVLRALAGGGLDG